MATLKARNTKRTPAKKPAKPAVKQQTKPQETNEEDELRWRDRHPVLFGIGCGTGGTLLVGGILKVVSCLIGGSDGEEESTDNEPDGYNPTLDD